MTVDYGKAVRFCLCDAKLPAARLKVMAGEATKLELDDPQPGMRLVLE